MDRIAKLAGMGWASPVGRTFAQAALAVLVAAGAGFVEVEVWRTAAVAGGASVLAYLQSSLRNR